MRSSVKNSASISYPSSKCLASNTALALVNANLRCHQGLGIILVEVKSCGVIGIVWGHVSISNLSKPPKSDTLWKKSKCLLPRNHLQ